jgi:phosphate transport system protein
VVLAGNEWDWAVIVAETYMEEFDRLAGMLATMSRATSALIQTANTALLTPDVEAADSVLAQRASLMELTAQFDAFVPEVIARRQPVASDMRLVVAGLKINADFARMGALCRHVAKIALSRYPARAVPDDVLPLVAGMAEAAATLANKSAIVMATRNPVDALQLALDDDEPDALQVQLYATLADGWRHGVQAAVDVAMLGRFYERFADHAVAVVEQVLYIVRGEPAPRRPV